MRRAHATDRSDLGIERFPIIMPVDGAPDRLDLFDVHRTRFCILPVIMHSGIRLRLARHDALPERRPCRICIDSRCGRDAAAPVMEEPVDRRAGLRHAAYGRLDHRTGLRIFLNAKPPAETPLHGSAIQVWKAFQLRYERLCRRDHPKRHGQLRHVPMDSLGLPTEGPLLLRALLAEDMFVSATIVLLLGALTVIGTLMSDILLGVLDPRIRMN